MTPDEVRAVDAASPEPVEVLIERAGAAVARVALAMLGGAYGRWVNVIAGPGKNGADGRAAAAVLEGRGCRTRIFDATTAPPLLPPADLTIDAAFGTGFRGSWKPPQVGLSPVLAVDLPSGVDARCGDVVGECLPADVTVTFQVLKPGHLLGRGRRLAGRLEVVDIGLGIGSSQMGLVEATDVARWWRPRHPDRHKWSRPVRVVAGSPGMTGAATLVATAAQRAGAGIVHVSGIGASITAPLEAVGRKLPESDWAAAVLEDIDRFAALAIGSGIGRDPMIPGELSAVIAGSPVPVVVDGDGLTALAAVGASKARVGRTAAMVLTPHDGEFAQLAKALPGPDRIEAARGCAAEFGAVMLLKGPTTIVADPDGRIGFIAHGTEALATAGSGDVLTGIIAAFLAAGIDPFCAAAGGAWIHAQTSRRLGRVGVVATDIVDLIPAALEALAHESGSSGSGW